RHLRPLEGDLRHGFPRAGFRAHARRDRSAESQTRNPARPAARQRHPRVRAGRRHRARTRVNLAALLRQQAHSRPDKPAIEYRGETWSYRECWRRVEELAAALHARGLGAGDRVGLCLGDHPEHVLLHFALARLGACLVPLDHRWSPAEKDAAAGTFRVEAIVTDGQDAVIDAATTIPLAALREAPRVP